MRLVDGVAPDFFDNESYLSLTRVLAYYGHLDGLALEAPELRRELGPLFA